MVHTHENGFVWFPNIIAKVKRKTKLRHTKKVTTFYFRLNVIQLQRLECYIEHVNRYLTHLYITTTPHVTIIYHVTKSHFRFPKTKIEKVQLPNSEMKNFTLTKCISNVHNATNIWKEYIRTPLMLNAYLIKLVTLYFFNRKPNIWVP